jgi:tetratricopeptide (TPR) repeat protein
MSRPVIFISYSHDSDKHRASILALAERLRQDGVDARIDQYINGTPDQGWPRWMLDQLDQASFVLVICTETYYRRFRGHEEQLRGKGADWEGTLITQEIYDAKSRTVKFVPVFLAADQELFIPEPLRPHTHYQLTSGAVYESLLRFLLGEAGVKPHPIGEVKKFSDPTVQTLSFDSSPSHSVSLPRYLGIPHRNPSFTGRKDLLSSIHRQLETHGISALAQAAIHGLGGIGKTELAIEYAHQYGEYYESVLWVVADSELSIRAAYLSIARDLGMADARTEIDEAVRLIKSWLSLKENLLLVFDNADDPALVRPYLPNARRDGKVLLTSRAKSFASVGIKEALRVETLDPVDAVTFLTSRTLLDDAQAASALAAELGFFPLALEQAAAYIETVGGGFAEYLARFRRQGIALFAKSKPSTDYPRTVATTWSLSFDAVHGASPASADILTTSAFLGPDAIPIEIFTRGKSHLGNRLSKKLEGAADDVLVFWELFEPLERYSLVERLGGDTFKLHRLTQAVIKHFLGNSKKRVWARRTIRAINAVYPAADFENWKYCDRLQPHALQASELIKEFGFKEYAAQRILAQVGWFAQIRGDYLVAKKLLKETLDIQERLLGSKHPYVLSAKSKLARTLCACGDFSGAKDLQRQALKAREVLWGSEHPHVLDAMGNLAEILRASGELEDAKDLQMRCLEIDKRVSGDMHPRTLASMNNLGLTLYELGDLNASRALHEQVLKAREEILGSEHPDTLGSRNNLALSLRALGDLDTARELYGHNLEICERVLGEQHPRTVIAAWNLLCVVQKLDDYKEFTQLIAKLRWLLGRDEDSIPSSDQRLIRQKLLALLGGS